MPKNPVVLIAENADLLYDAILSCVHRINHEAEAVHVRDLDVLTEEAEHAEAFSLVILDTDLGGFWDLPSADMLLEKLSIVPLALLTGAFNESQRERALDHGAKAYLSKAAPRPLVIASLGLAMCGRSYYEHLGEDDDPDFSPGQIYGDLRIPSDAASKRPLTRRHLQVLQLLTEGMKNAEIARELGIAESTVRLHLWEAYRRLGVANRTQAVREVIRLRSKTEKP